MNPRLAKILSWVVTLLTPVGLVLLIGRLFLTPLFPPLEYRMLGFPPDPYGFTLADRVKWSGYAWRYPLNSAGISYLGDLRFSDGSSVFNARELSHMQDVKSVVQGTLKVFYVTMALLVGLGVYAWLGKWKASYLRGLSRGGWLTVWIIGAIGLFAAVSFWNFFTDLHEVFFSGNSWLFEYSDTLIRLFPLRFWQDVFLSLLGLSLLGGLLLGVLVKPKAPDGA